MITLAAMVTAAVGLAGPAPSAWADVGAPPPPPPQFVVAAPPRLVVVPQTPVFYAPRLNVNLFADGGRSSPYYVGPWSFLRVPPGHLKHRARNERGRDDGHRGRDLTASAAGTRPIPPGPRHHVRHVRGADLSKALGRPNL